MRIQELLYLKCITRNQVFSLILILLFFVIFMEKKLKFHAKSISKIFQDIKPPATYQRRDKRVYDE